MQIDGLQEEVDNLFPHLTKFLNFQLTKTIT